MLVCARPAKAEPLAAAEPLRDGDIVFQESTSRQSELLRRLTRSRWTHVGVVVVGRNGPLVLEAVSPVKLTPLARWVARGRGGRYVAKRVRGEVLTADVLARLRAQGHRWLGRPYDLRFRWDDGALYCSELVHKLFAAAGIHLGRLQHASDMNLSDPLVQRALAVRFAGARFDPNEVVVTPDAIFNDPQLVEVPR